MKKSLLFLILLIFFIIESPVAQQFSAIPASVKWRQINTDNFRIIFPNGIDSPALRIAHILDAIRQHTPSPLGNKFKKISIVLHAQTTFSNGYVGLGPWRSEYFLTPDPNSLELGSLPWNETLALHEYRHVEQYSNFNKGLSKFFSIVLGQEGQAFANNTALPDWFWEGDAVWQETMLSKQGRGRLPNFYNGYRALWHEGKHYTYMQLRNGSFRHFIPDHYKLGYLLVSYGNEKYGNDFWKKVTDETVRYKSLFYPMQKAVERNAGIAYKKFVNDAFEYYKPKMLENREGNATKVLLPPRATVTDYTYPVITEDGSIIALKRSYRQIPEFVRVSDGNETTIRVKDISLDDQFSYRNGKIVYAGYKADARWGWRDYSVLNILDIHSGQQQRITTGSKYFMPDISEDGTLVVAMEYSKDQKSSLHILNASTGQLVRKLPNPDSWYFSYPKFSEDGKRIISAVRDKQGKMAIVEMDTEQGQASVIIPFSNHALAFPVERNGVIYFSAAFAGTDRLMAYEKESKQVYEVKKLSGGNYQPYVSNNNEIAWSSFTAEGFEILKEKAERANWKPVSLEGEKEDLYLSPQVLKLNAMNVLQDETISNYNPEKYPKSFKPINIHSWRPWVTESEYSFTLFGQNVLNTVQSALSYTYNINEESHRARADIFLGGWYPVFNIGGDETWHRSFPMGDTLVTWNELNTHAGAYIPFDFSGGRNFRFLTIGSSFNYVRQDITGLAKSIYLSGDVKYFEHYLFWSMQSQKAVQHILPRFAHNVFIQYNHAADNRSANQFLARGALYLPGLHVNHNLVLTAAYQGRDTLNQYIFDNNFPFSRGYTKVNFPRTWKFGANYHFPLVYPDWGFGQMVYFLRIRANLFYDFTESKSLRTGNKYDFTSTGCEVYFDTKVWNQLPVTIGVRYSRLLDEDFNRRNPNQWEIILPVDLF